jgi:hypothetical protein
MAAIAVRGGRTLIQVNARRQGALCKDQSWLQITQEVGCGSATAGTMSLPRPQPSAKRCPVCRGSMLGSRTRPTHREFDHFECFNCGLFMDFSGSKDPGLEYSNDEATFNAIM